MTKSDVLTLVGNPTRTDRRHSQDRWVYEVSGADSDALTYIFFAEGRVTYVGDSKAPDGPTGNSSAEAVPNSLAPGGGFRPVGDTDLPEKK